MCQETRRSEIDNVLERVYATKRPHEVPLYEDLAPQILQELEGQGCILDGESDPQVEVWRHLASRAGALERSAFPRGGLAGWGGACPRG